MKKRFFRKYAPKKVHIDGLTLRRYKLWPDCGGIVFFAETMWRQSAV
jgi:hypothetical protein